MHLEAPGRASLGGSRFVRARAHAATKVPKKLACSARTKKALYRRYCQATLLVAYAEKTFTAPGDAKVTLHFTKLGRKLVTKLDRYAKSARQHHRKVRARHFGVDQLFRAEGATKVLGAHRAVKLR